MQTEYPDLIIEGKQVVQLVQCRWRTALLLHSKEEKGDEGGGRL